MKKRVVTLIAVLTVVCAQLNGYAQEFKRFSESRLYNYYQLQSLDVFNNELFEITGQISPEEAYNILWSGNDDKASYAILRKDVFNDGLTARVREVEDDYGEGAIVYLTDIDNNVVFDPGKIAMPVQTTQYHYSNSYNLGYLHENINIMDDFNNMISHTNFVNMLTGESYYFKNLSIERFYHDGSMIISQFDNGDSVYHKAQLKKPVIVTVELDNVKIAFDQIPVIDNDRTLVPLRAIFEKLGAEVSWDDATKTVTAVKDSVTVSLTVNNTTAIKNGESIALEVPAKIINGRTMVPVRFIADAFGVGVDWDNEMKTVILTTN